MAYNAERESRGQNLVEFALILPLLLVLTLGVLDAGRLFGAWIGLKNASREAARYATLYAGQTTVAAIQDRAIAEAGIADLTRGHVQVLTPSGWGDGRPVTVRITYPFQLLTTMVFGTATINLSASTEMVIIRGD